MIVKELRMTTTAVLLLTYFIVGIRSETSSCPEDSIISKDGECECGPCPPRKCESGFLPVEETPGTNTPGECCSLYRCERQVAISWVRAEDSMGLGGCMDSSGIPRASGEHWQDGPCTNCSCEEGHMACQATMCKSCENPKPLEAGECCQRCPALGNTTNDISNEKCEPLTNCELHCAVGFATDSSGCPTCQCIDDEQLGDIRPIGVEKICPHLSDCKLTCNLANDEDDCPVCACQENDDHPSTIIPLFNEEHDINENQVTPKKKICPALSCDLHCEKGLAIDEDGCTMCACHSKPGCPPFSCKKDCPMGYKTNKRGCQICRCRLSCVDSRNETHPENSKWSPDYCTTCYCDQSGRLACNQTVCSIPCKDPIPPQHGECCPVCPIKENGESVSSPGGMRGWAHLTVTVVLAILCIGLTINAVRGRFRGRLAPSEASYTAYPAQYYKCIPAYDTPVHQSEKIIPL